MVVVCFTGICILPTVNIFMSLITWDALLFLLPNCKQGWMNTSAFSVIDVAKQEYVGAVLVDEPERGAAGIWSMDCTDEYLLLSIPERMRSALLITGYVEKS